jgi:hypothetical protein
MNAFPKQTESLVTETERQNLEELIAETMPPTPLRPWTERGYDARRFAFIGMLLGGIAGCTSLLLNVIGSLFWTETSGEPQHPLHLIQVYLTFPLGASALELGSGALLGLGCLMYLVTGMVYGMLFELALSHFLPHAGAWMRLIVCGVIALSIWSINYYAILVWLQPTLFGGRWIVDLIPAWVGAVTHLAFGCTMALLFPLGEKHSSIRRSL